MVPGIGQSPGTPDGAILLPTLSPAQTQSDAGVFQKLVSGSLQQAGGLNTESHTLSGADLVMTESVVAMRQADIAMRLMLQLQGKLVDAWNELRNMQA
jgi:flagellar hook-basal body complex protein FliE